MAISKKKFKHIKKFNTGFIYECLVRYMAKAILDKDKKEILETKEILKKYFAKGKPLANELQLFNVILAADAPNENVAKNILGEVACYAKTLDSDLSSIKIMLNEDIKARLKGSGAVFNFEIPFYKVLASISMIVDNARKTKMVFKESVQKAVVEDFLVKYMTSGIKSETSGLVQNPDYNNIVYKLTCQKFFTKYNKLLNESQKALIKRYIYSGLNNKYVEDLKKFIMAETRDIRMTLSTANVRQEIKENKEVADKIKLALEDFNKTDFVKDISDANVEKLMRFQALAKEIKSNE